MMTASPFSRLIVLATFLFGAVLLFLFFYPLHRVTTDLAVRAEAYCDDDTVAAVEISRSHGVIKVVSALLGGGADYYPEDGGQPTSCPVVGPDVTTPECVALQKVTDWEYICGDR